ncbi:tetratricopeptide repeat protein [Niabella beijingensis]|uniref:tetratricopeptide repeat protein n=1 Tax=Niabella beijingensis TaxID=2872700 RepID=UPI001CC129CE|nr:tetratricopeptide repeat protein [Niabella beijingensis]MBZ4190645.1 tetratricopeptide repeat protein [Niabella beijingensis]
MKYVPDLIPERSKVLPDYFKEGPPCKPAKKSKASDVLMWILGAIFFLFALISIRHPALFILHGLIGFILIPPGHNYLERNLHFILTSKIKTITALALFIASIPLMDYYQKIDRKIAHEKKLAAEKKAKEDAIAAEQDRQRADSLTFYVQQSTQLIEKRKIDDAEKKLKYALSFASTQEERKSIAKQQITIATIRTEDLVKAEKYKAALPKIDSLLNSDPQNTDLRYNRALCYAKTGKIAEAVSDLKPLIEAGNTNAQKLHNKVNPIRKRITGYITLCRDGTTSNARGRGACSWHGGVKDWNYPIYEESRKYE